MSNVFQLRPKQSDFNPRIVIVDGPIYQWSNPVVWDLFHQMIALKLNGYGSEYAEGVISVDTTDFYGTHLFVCDEERNGALKILVGYRSVELARCQHHFQGFPAFGVLASSGVELTKTRLQQVIDKSAENKRRISYDSSWTMDPEVRRNRVLSRYLRDLITTIGVNYHLDGGPQEWITCGVLRFKTNEYFQWMGHEPISPLFQQHSLNGAEVMMMHLSRYSDEAIAVAKEHAEFWANRIIFSEKALKQAA